MLKNMTQLSTSEKLKFLKKDFLQRDQNTFVLASQKNRLGWDSGMTAEQGYSADILRNPLELIKESYTQARDILACMDIPGPKVKLQIIPQSSDSYSTESRKIFVATKVFDETGLTPGQKMDIFLGLTIHEGCHVLYTDFNAKAQLQKDLEHELQNIIEDERIERLYGQQMPGYVEKFVAATKYHYFHRYHEELLKTQAGQPKLPAPARLINTLLCLIRFPKSVELDNLEEFADPLYECIRHLESYQGGYPQSNQDVILASRELYKIIFDYFKKDIEDELKNAKNKANQGEKGQNEGNPSQNSGSGSNEPQNSESGQSSSQGSEAESKNAAQDGQDESSNDGNMQPAGQPDSDNGAGTGKGNELSKEEQAAAEKAAKDILAKLTADMKKALEQLHLNGKDNNAAMVSSTLNTKEGHRLGKCVQGEMEMNGTVNIKKAEEDTAGYMDSLARVRQYVSLIGRRIALQSETQAYVLQGTRSGQFDTNKLAEAYQGVPTVYRQVGTIKSNRIAVCIVIDESGSMWGEKTKVARDTAVLLNEALRKIGTIDLYIYGHTADREYEDMYVYREPGFCKKHALGTIDSRHGNRDSKIITEAVRRIRKNTDSPCLMFVITDGAPNEGPELVKAAVKKAEKDGFTIAAISLESHYDPKVMYTHSLNVTDMGTLDYSSMALNISKLIKSAISGNLKKTIQF